LARSKAFLQALVMALLMGLPSLFCSNDTAHFNEG